ncbi:MAG: glycosyltransferase [Ilumatobacteraceae bacterium]
MARICALVTVLTRLLRRVTASPPVTAASVARSDDITVVIPARDEAARIGPAIRAVIDAPGVREVVVVDDQSSDGTGSLAAANGARVVDAGERPVGWAGKTWAVERGLDAAHTTWVLMLDADTRADPRLPSAAVSRAIDDRLDLLSVAGRFRPGRPGAQWLHASLLAALVYRFGSPGSGGRIVANGQCMLVRREAWRAHDGMAAVADSVVEDVALARWMVSSGARVAFLDATDLLEVEPYGSLAATWAGWGRSIGLAGVDPLARRLLDVVVLALVMPVPVVRMLIGRADVIDLAAVVTRLGVLAGTRVAYVERGASYWLSPVADPLAIAALVTGLVRRRQTWRGRSYDLPVGSAVSRRRTAAR